MNVESILAFLQVTRQPASRQFLDELVAAYVQTVSWESASRLSRQQTISDPLQRGQTADQFWENCLQHRSGGTCFESNGAFLPLLQALGFEGYLTINDMNEQCGCHTACIIFLDGEKWLVDVGYPLYVPIRLTPDQPSTCTHPVHDFTTTPLGNNRYEITRSRHPIPYIFTLIDEAITAEDYDTARREDYLPGGNFNKEPIIRILKGEENWVYNGRVEPPVLEYFINETHHIRPFEADIPAQLHRLFQIDESIIRAAFDVLDKQ